MYVCRRKGCRLNNAEPFKTPEELAFHHQIEHSREQDKTHFCTEAGCGKGFGSNGALRRHLRSHSGERPYICPYPGCDKAYAQRCHLKTHYHVHTGERPYKCLVPGCGKAFAGSGTLHRHQSVHTRDRRFVCPHCSRGFTRKCGLRLHILNLHPHLVGTIQATLDDAGNGTPALGQAASPPTSRSPAPPTTPAVSCAPLSAHVTVASLELLAKSSRQTNAATALAGPLGSMRPWPEQDRTRTVQHAGWPPVCETAATVRDPVQLLVPKLQQPTLDLKAATDGRNERPGSWDADQPPNRSLLASSASKAALGESTVRTSPDHQPTAAGIMNGKIGRAEQCSPRRRPGLLPSIQELMHGFDSGFNSHNRSLYGQNTFQPHSRPMPSTITGV